MSHRDEMRPCERCGKMTRRWPQSREIDHPRVPPEWRGRVLCCGCEAAVYAGPSAARQGDLFVARRR